MELKDKLIFGIENSEINAYIFRHPIFHGRFRETPLPQMSKFLKCLLGTKINLSLNSIFLEVLKSFCILSYQSLAATRRKKHTASFLIVFSYHLFP